MFPDTMSSALSSFAYSTTSLEISEPWVTAQTVWNHFTVYLTDEMPQCLGDDGRDDSLVANPFRPLQRALSITVRCGSATTSTSWKIALVACQIPLSSIIGCLSQKQLHPESAGNRGKLSHWVVRGFTESGWSLLYSQARANRRSRWMVAFDLPRSSEVSSTVQPRK